MRTATLLRALVLSCVAASLPGAAAQAAPAGEANPLPRFLEAIQVGPAEEFRLAVLHPIYVPPPAAKVDVPAFVATAPQEALAVSTKAKDSRTSASVHNLATTPYWTLPGDVVRLGDADYTVREDAILAAGATTEVDVVKTSATPQDEKPRQEPRWVGALPGPAFFWTVLSGAKEKAMTAAAADFAKESGLSTPRKSPVELATAEKIAARVREYRTRLATLPKSAAAGKRELAGVAIVLDGCFAGVEMFADASRFAAVWPSRLEGIAVEAALLELENGVLEDDLAEPTDPDRFVSAVKDTLLALYAVEAKPVTVAGLGEVLTLRKDPDLGRAVIREGAGPQHLIWVRDPARRRANDTPESPEMNPGEIARKMRPTVAEKRWLDRRKTGGE